MLTTLRQVFALFSRDERRRFAGLLLVMVVMGFLEVAGIVSIMPFMALVATPEAITRSGFLRWLYSVLDFHDLNVFLFALGCLTLALLAISNAFSAFATWLILRFVYAHEHVLAMRLLARYLGQPYVFFLGRNTAELAKKLFSDVSIAVHGLLIPCMQAVSRSVVALFIFAALLVVDALLACTVAAALAGAYAFVYALFRGRLRRIGEQYQTANTERFRFAGEALGGIKEIKLYHREAAFRARFSRASASYAKHFAAHQILSLLPRYALEVVAFGGIIVMVLYLLTVRRDLDYVLPLLALYALAGYRVMPALQQIFSAMTNLRFHAESLAGLVGDLGLGDGDTSPVQPTAERVRLRRELVLENITFTYPGGVRPVITGLSLSIGANTSIAFVGATGVGKTTLVDLIMGLLPLTAGEMRADGERIGPHNLARWQSSFGYVPQQIYLTDESISRNIAFGVPEGAIDESAVRRAAQIAHLHEFVARELPNGYATVVGERGVRLSGGQRQRIGIARALYRDPDILVFDEATSALDSATESAVMEALRELSGKKTVIIIAHRLTTITGCDIIHLLDGGGVAASGSYAELLAGNETFRRLAANLEAGS